MNNKWLQGLLLAALSSVAACSGASPPDPTSSEALKKAPPMKWGSTCIEKGSYSAGDLSGSTSDAQCLDGRDCADIPPITTALGTTYYTDVGYFEGTCGDPHPVSCDQRPRPDDCTACQYDECCTFVALCDDDPNCSAIVDCVNGCKSDQACAQRCVDNGQYDAARHFEKAMTCLDNKCKDRCQ